MKSVLFTLFGLFLSISSQAGLPKEDDVTNDLRNRFIQARTPEEGDIYDSVFKCQGRKALAGNFQSDFMIDELIFNRTIGYLPFVSAHPFRLNDRALIKYNFSYVAYLNHKGREEFIALRVGDMGELLWEASLVANSGLLPIGLNPVVRYPQKTVAHAYGVCERL